MLDFPHGGRETTLMKTHTIGRCGNCPLMFLPGREDTRFSVYPNSTHHTAQTSSPVETWPELQVYYY